MNRHDAEASAVDRALVLVLLGTGLLVSPARLLWARGLLAVAAIFAVWVALIALAAIAAREGRGEGRGEGGRGEGGRGEGGRGDRGPPP